MNRCDAQILSRAISTWPPTKLCRFVSTFSRVAARHSHPGEEIAYVIEGTLEYKLDGREPITLSAGQSLFIPTGVAHSAENVGAGKASELATYIVRKGQALVVPSK